MTGYHVAAQREQEEISIELKRLREENILMRDALDFIACGTHDDADFYAEPDPAAIAIAMANRARSALEAVKA